MSDSHSPDDRYAADPELLAMDADFAETPVEETTFQEIPDGKYQVNVDSVERTKTKTSQKPMLKWTLRILGPRFAGRLMWRNHVIMPGRNIAWIKQDLHTCGLDLAKISDIDAHLHLLLDVKLEVTKKTVGDSTNVYFNRRLASAEVAPGAPDGYAGTDQPPF